MATRENSPVPKTQADAALAAAERLFAVVEAGNLDEMRNVFADGATIWHNTDDTTIGVEQSIAGIRAILGISDRFHYTEVRRAPTPSGFVQQHTLLVRLKDGRELADRACCVCTVRDGRITHMDAYHDSATFKDAGFPSRKSEA